MKIITLLLILVLTVTIASCLPPPDSFDPLPEDPVNETPEDPVPEPVVLSVLVVVGNPSGLVVSESMMISRLQGQGYNVSVVDDSVLTRLQADLYDLVIMSKTVQSTAVGTKLKGTQSGVIFWEDNQQMLSMMATINNDGSSGTAWHSTRYQVTMVSGAPSALTAGLTGTVSFYTSDGEMTWSPAGQLSSEAIPIARLGNSNSEQRYVIYAYEKESRLADGTTSAGRRVYFGLYDDTFSKLTNNGLTLFDVAVTWALNENSSGTPSIPEGWIFCADENQFCSFDGTALVRYGLDGSFVYQTHTNGVSCGNSVFGDPLPGASKDCYYSYTEEEPTNTVNITPSGITYSASITITSGGTYTGNWESTSQDIPAVRIRTSQPVTIKNSNTRSVGDHIKSDWGFNANVTVINTSGMGIAPSTNGSYPGRFIHLDSYSGLYVENSYMEQTSGIYLHAAVDGSIVKVLRNKAKNIDGRRSDGVGGYSGVRYVQFVQLNRGNLHNTEIAWNEVINEPWNSFVEDIVSLHEVSGRETDPIRVHNNFFRGGYPIDPATSSYSGGGIMLGDGRNGNKYLHGYDNHVVSTSNYGIAISAGEHNRMYNNRILSCGFVTNPNTGAEVFISSQNVGAYIWNIHGVTNYQNNSGSNNAIAWMKTTTTRNDRWTPNAESWTGQTSLITGIVPCSLEDDEYNLWLQKVNANQMKIGVLR